MKKICVTFSLDVGLQDQMVKELEKLSFLKDAELFFVHIFKEESYPFLMPPIFYPVIEQKKEIAESLTSIFQKITENTKGKEKHYHVEFNNSPEDGLVNFLNHHRCDFVITLMREHKGLTNYFTGSFSEYLVKHAPCPVIVLRSK